jgi:hypothetical protein
VIVEAIHYAKTNREAALKIMQKYLRVQDREALEDAYESFRRKTVPAGTVRHPCCRRDYLRGAIDKLYAQTR